jgi:hypothetical protein
MTPVNNNNAADYAQRSFGKNNNVKATEDGDAIVTPKPNTPPDVSNQETRREREMSA